MNSNTKTKARCYNIKLMKGPDPPPSRENNSGLSPALPFVKPSKGPGSDKQNDSINMGINNTVSKNNKTKYDTNIFKVIETFGYNGVDLVKKLRTLGLDIFTPYALNSSLLVKRHLGLFLIVMKVNSKMQFKESIMDFQNKPIVEYND